MEPLVQVRNLKKYFPVNQGWLQGLAGGEDATIKAVDDVSFDIFPGQTVGLAGESGCGKSTLANLLLGLLEPTSGTISFDGQDINSLRGKDRLKFRGDVQLVFQNPFEAMNPRFTIARAVMEPLIVQGIGRTRQDRLDRVREALETVNLDPDVYGDRFPHELSGGQLQRVVLARALAPKPRFIVADEPTSMLDVSVRAGVLNLMQEITRREGVTTLYVSHDLSLLRYMCDRTMIMYLGEICELGGTDQVLADPKHPYTRALVSAVPSWDPDQPTTTVAIKDGVPNAARIPSGCRFRERCPVAMDKCTQVEPELKKVADDQQVRCLLYDDPGTVHNEKAGEAV